MGTVFIGLLASLLSLVHAPSLVQSNELLSGLQPAFIETLRALQPEEPLKLYPNLLPGFAPETTHVGSNGIFPDLSFAYSFHSLHLNKLKNRFPSHPKSKVFKILEWLSKVQIKTKFYYGIISLHTLKIEAVVHLTR